MSADMQHISAGTSKLYVSCLTMFESLIHAEAHRRSVGTLKVSAVRGKVERSTVGTRASLGSSAVTFRCTGVTWNFIARRHDCWSVRTTRPVGKTCSDL